MQICIPSYVYRESYEPEKNHFRVFLSMKLP